VSKPQLSIIIPALNEENFLDSLLPSLFKQKFSDFEIIVADGGSSDGTVQIAKSFGVQVVSGGWPSVGRNAGAEVANGRVLLFLDADVEIGADFLEKTVAYFDRSNLDMANFTFAFPLKNNLAAIIYLGWNILQRISIVLDCNWASGAGIIITREKFFSLSGFNPQLRFGEDFDLAKRVVKSGGKFAVLPIKILPSTRRYNRGEIMGLLRSYWGAKIRINKELD
jgi:glycosyltransferase involved in cell wall biosynthesis